MSKQSIKESKRMLMRYVNGRGKVQSLTQKGASWIQSNSVKVKVNAIHNVADDKMKAVQQTEIYSSLFNELASPVLTCLATCSYPRLSALLVRLRSIDVIGAMQCKQCKCSVFWSRIMHYCPRH